MWIIITAHSESILSYLSIKYGRDISRGDSISTKIRSGRVVIEIKIGMPILIYPNSWDGSGSLSSNFRDKNWGKLRFSLTFPDVFWLIFSNFETKSWEKSRTIPTLPDFDPNPNLSCPWQWACRAFIFSQQCLRQNHWQRLHYLFKQIQKQLSSYFPKICWFLVILVSSPRTPLMSWVEASSAYPLRS